MLILIAAADLRFLLFPAVLLGYYLVCWARVGRDPKIADVPPQYEPPAGISAAVARYIRTGGSDGTTLAAVLAQLAAKGVLAIQPQSGKYHIELLQQETPVLPEEAALVQALFSQKMQAQTTTPSRNDSEEGVPDELREAVKKLPVQQLASQGLAVAAELAAEPRKVALVDPKSSAQIKLLINAIQETFRRNFAGVYFRWNFIYVGLGMAATFLFALATSFFVGTTLSPATFVTLWLLLFTSIAGIVIAGSFSSRPTKPTGVQKFLPIVVPLLFFVLPGFLIAEFALPSAQVFVLALLLSVAMNSIFMVLMRAPTKIGQQALRQLAGFREFLVRVEQDRLQRINTPEEKARLMNRYLPYAIALGVKEGWGDSMAAAFSNAIVER